MTPRDFQVLVVARALRIYMETGRKVNTAYTLPNMLATAGKITGKTYSKIQRREALADLEAIIAGWKSQVPIPA